jgi:hypothetical protein
MASCAVELKSSGANILNLPLADYTATEMWSIGLCELPFFTEPTVTKQIARLIEFGVIV